MLKSQRQRLGTSTPTPKLHAAAEMRVPPTLSDAFALFLTSSPFTERTRQSYGEDVAPWLATIGSRPVSALTLEHVRQFLMAQIKLSPATYNRRLAAVRSFCRWLVHQRWFPAESLLSLDNVESLQRRADERQIQDRLEPDAVEAVLHGIPDPRDRALFWLLYDGGLTCSEALLIDLEDIDWAERAIHIQMHEGQLREIVFSRPVATMLKKYLEQRGNPETGPLFTTHRKTQTGGRSDKSSEGYVRLSYRQVDTRWKQYTPGWTLHQLRRTALSIRVANGYTDVDLKRFSGHGSLRSVERYFAENRKAGPRSPKPSRDN